MSTDTGEPADAAPDELEGAGQEPEEPLSNRWIDLFRVDEAPELQPEMFAEALADLGKLLETRPEAKSETIALLERQFGAGLARGTWAAATSSLSNYSGPGVAYLVNWLVYQNTGMRLTMIDGLADAAAVSYLRSIVARFWDEFNAAQILVSASADDWTRIDKHVFFDTLEGGYHFSVKLTMATGEVTTLEMTADSTLNLTRHLMAMIVAVGGPQDYSPDQTMAFLQQLVQLSAFFFPDETSQEGAEGAADVGTPAG